MFAIRKYMGDDSYSWAVFRKSDLPKGHRGVYCGYYARPIVSGLSRGSAQHYKRTLEQKEKS